MNYNDRTVHDKIGEALEELICSIAIIKTAGCLDPPTPELRRMAILDIKKYLEEMEE